jgi:interferon gamma-inducible protein 30
MTIKGTSSSIIQTVLLLSTGLVLLDARLSEPVAAAPPAAAAARVRVQAYTEALCTGCAHFMLESLIPTYDKLGGDVIDLEWVPFGNAKLLDADHILECQHGEAECDANSWEQCAVYVYKDKPQVYLNMLKCLEKALPMGHQDTPFDESIFQKCAGCCTDFSKIKECHDNPMLAWQLQSQANQATPDDHQYVPWVVVNGQFLDVENDDLLQVICKEYTAGGGSHPSCDDDVYEDEDTEVHHSSSTPVVVGNLDVCLCDDDVMMFQAATHIP